MSFADELKKLLELLEAGAITQEFFDEERDRMVARRSASDMPARASSGEYRNQVGAYQLIEKIGV